MTKGAVPFGVCGTNGLLYCDQPGWEVAWWTLDLDFKRLPCITISGLCTCWCHEKNVHFLGARQRRNLDSLYANPICCNFILAYLIGHRKDESFILYGAAVAFLIDR